MTFANKTGTIAITVFEHYGFCSYFALLSHIPNIEIKNWSAYIIYFTSKLL